MSNTSQSLYIKRAETNQTEEYIKQALSNYGIVDSLEFIQKSNDKGQKYNGVIVLFKQWNFNNLVEDLWKELHANVDANVKFYHGPRNSKFWMVTEYKIPVVNKITESNIEIDLTNFDEKSISIINHLQLQNKLLQSKLQSIEQLCMQSEHDRMNSWIQCTGAKFEVEDRDIQLGWKDEEICELKLNNSLLIKKNTKLMNENLNMKLELKRIKKEFTLI
jgi:hypothetical protein